MATKRKSPRQPGLEQNWVLDWFRESGVYLKAFGILLTTATAVLVRWERFFGAEFAVPQSLRWAVLASAMLLALWFNIIPALRRNREEKERPTGESTPGYFKTTPRDANDPYGFFTGKNAARYEPFLGWVKHSKSPILHLTGLSGVGKSSLITAYLAPALMESDPPARVVVVRTAEDPETALKDALADDLWKRRPENWDSLTSTESLNRAVDRLGSSERLVVVLDQFEEVFLLGADASPVLPSDGPRLMKLANFLREFMAAPLRRVTLMLSYREDHAALLEPLNLPARTEGANWKRLDPFRCEQASRFLNGVPNFKVPPERLGHVIAEAVGYERDKIFVRPIVANLLGLVLEWMKDHPTFWKNRADLLRHYVRLKLGREMVAERSALLRAMITDFQTARSRSAADLATLSRLSPVVLSNQLENLSSAGLVRCLSGNDIPQAEREWQIAHDFVATLCERVIDAAHRSFWSAAKPWLAPSAIALWLVVGLGTWPWVEEHRAIAALTEAGLSWNKSAREVSTSAWGQEHLKSLDGVHQALVRFQPRKINLNNCQALTNVEGLKGLTSLQSLNLTNCWYLANDEGLNGLTSLQSLDLSLCGLTNVEGLKGLISLQSLNLSFCRLTNAEALKGLTSLTNLNLSSCTTLINVEGLKGLASLQSLDLTNCQALTNAEGLKGLTSLQSLDLSNCGALTNVEGLKGLTSLQRLDLRGLRNVPPGAFDALRQSLPTCRIIFPN